MKQKAGLFTYERLNNRVTIQLAGEEIDITKAFIKAMILFLTDGDAPAPGKGKKTNLVHHGEVRWSLEIIRHYGDEEK